MYDHSQGLGATITIQWHHRLWLSEGLSQATLVMIGARGTGTIPLIASIRRHAKLCYRSITTQHLINGRKFISWNCFILIVRKPDFFCLHSIRMNTVHLTTFAELLETIFNHSVRVPNN